MYKLQILDAHTRDTHIHLHTYIHAYIHQLASLRPSTNSNTPQHNHGDNAQETSQPPGGASASISSHKSLDSDSLYVPCAVKTAHSEASPDGPADLHLAPGLYIPDRRMDESVCLSTVDLQTCVPSRNIGQHQRSESINSSPWAGHGHGQGAGLTSLTSGLTSPMLDHPKADSEMSRKHQDSFGVPKSALELPDGEDAGQSRANSARRHVLNVSTVTFTSNICTISPTGSSRSSGAHAHSSPVQGNVATANVASLSAMATATATVDGTAATATATVDGTAATATAGVSPTVRRTPRPLEDSAEDALDERMNVALAGVTLLLE